MHWFWDYTNSTWDIFPLCSNRSRLRLVYNSLSELPRHTNAQREKERQTQRARKRAGRRPSEQPAVFPLFCRIFKSCYSKVTKQNKCGKKATQIRSLICWSALSLATVFLSSKIRSFTESAKSRHPTVLSTVILGIKHSEMLKGKKNVMREKKPQSQRPQLFIASHPSVFLH